jgi:hypothetical protein
MLNFFFHAAHHLRTEGNVRITANPKLTNDTGNATAKYHLTVLCKVPIYSVMLNSIVE